MVRAASVLALAALCGSCSSVVKYTDEMTDPASGRTFVTVAPANFFGLCGFIIGIPFDVIALPVSYPILQTTPAEDRDPLSTLLFPSFVLWRCGVLLAAPIDGLEYLAYRSWHGDRKLSAEERELIELELDAQELPDYPVEVLYPRPRTGGVAP